MVMEKRMSTLGLTSSAMPFAVGRLTVVSLRVLALDLNLRADR